MQLLHVFGDHLWAGAGELLPNAGFVVTEARDETLSLESNCHTRMHSLLRNAGFVVIEARDETLSLVCCATCPKLRRLLVPLPIIISLYLIMSYYIIIYHPCTLSSLSFSEGGQRVALTHQGGNPIAPAYSLCTVSLHCLIQVGKEVHPLTKEAHP